MKQIVLAVLLSTLAEAIDFESFLEHTLNQSPYVRSSQLVITQAEEEGKKALRYENPSIEIEASRFKPDSGGRDTGYRASLDQPIRLWGVSDNKERLAQSGVDNAKADSAVTRAQFIYNLSLLYTDYAQNTMSLELGDEELHIAQKIYDISSIRYESGTISRGAMLQVKVAFKQVQNDNAERHLVQMRSYYSLLEYAGINEELELDTGYVFTIDNKKENRSNPELLKLDTEKRMALSRAQVNTSKVEWMSLLAEYENEPDQDIYRIGLSIPLAVFNTRGEEKTIAMLEAQRKGLLYKNKKEHIGIQERYLEKEAEALSALQEKSLEILRDEKELLSMFEEAYKIANVNLLELQDIKNRVISTKKRLITIKTALNCNAINQNYLQGNYNE